jgi:peptidoglycan/xylan/chitin deacetylase (PgdA/CDA1 family)
MSKQWRTRLVVAACIPFGLFVYLWVTGCFRCFGRGNLDHTYVSLRFDDGWKTQLRAYDALKEHDLPGSIYIISGVMETEDKWMDWTDVETVNEIMEIGGHTVSHADLKNCTARECERQIGDDYRALVERGFAPSTFVYPYGNYNATTLEIVKKYYICASTQAVGVNSDRTDVYRLRDFTLRSGNTMDNVKKAVCSKSWTIFTFHDIGEPHPDSTGPERGNAVSVAFFEEILEWLEESDIKVITVAEGCEMLRELQGLE